MVEIFFFPVVIIGMAHGTLQSHAGSCGQVSPGVGRLKESQTTIRGCNLKNLKKEALKA